MNVERLRVVLADDHPVYRDGLARLLTEIGGFDVVATASDGKQAVELAESLRPDVIVMDIRMPELDGIEATRKIIADNPDIGIVVLTMFDDDELVFASLRAGARGYLMKDARDDQIADVIRGVARGDAVFGPTATKHLLERLDRGAAVPDTPVARFPGLTAREHEVLERLARGERNDEIARHLFLGERTVRNYVSNIFTKLGVENRGAGDRHGAPGRYGLARPEAFL